MHITYYYTEFEAQRQSFADGIFKLHFLYEACGILFRITLKFVSRVYNQE